MNGDAAEAVFEGLPVYHIACFFHQHLNVVEVRIVQAPDYGVVKFYHMAHNTRLIDLQMQVLQLAELHLKPLAFRRFFDRKMLPVPADARSRVIAAERFAAVRHDVESRVVDKWQLDRPVVRQVDRMP